MNSIQLNNILSQNKCCFCDKISIALNTSHSNQTIRMFKCHNCLINFNIYYFNGAYLYQPPCTYNIHYNSIIIEHMSNHHRSNKLTIYLGAEHIMQLPFIDFSAPDQAKQFLKKVKTYSLLQ